MVQPSLDHEPDEPLDVLLREAIKETSDASNKIQELTIIKRSPGGQ